MASPGHRTQERIRNGGPGKHVRSSLFMLSHKSLLDSRETEQAGSCIPSLLVARLGLVSVAHVLGYTLWQDHPSFGDRMELLRVVTCGHHLVTSDCKG